MLLEMVAEAGGDRVVVGSRSGGISATGLLAAGRRAAKAFASTGAANVVWLDYNSDALPVALFGAAIAGLAFVPVNYRLADAALTAILERATPGVVVAGTDMVARASGIEGLSIVETDDLMAQVVGRAGGVDRVAGGAGGGAADESVWVDPDESVWVDPEAVAVLLFTSGTTGEPKAAVLRHRHLASYILSSVEFMAAEPGETQLVSVPPYHIAGVSSILSSNGSSPATASGG